MAARTSLAALDLKRLHRQLCQGCAFGGMSQTDALMLLGIHSLSSVVEKKHMHAYGFQLDNNVNTFLHEECYMTSSSNMKTSSSINLAQSTNQARHDER